MASYQPTETEIEMTIISIYAFFFIKNYLIKTIALHLSNAYFYQILYFTFDLPCQKSMLGVQNSDRHVATSCSSVSWSLEAKKKQQKIKNNKFDSNCEERVQAQPNITAVFPRRTLRFVWKVVVNSQMTQNTESHSIGSAHMPLYCVHAQLLS